MFTGIFSKWQKNSANSAVRLLKLAFKK